MSELAKTASKRKSGGGVKALLNRSEFTIGIVVIALFFVCYFGTDTFGSRENLVNLMKQASICGVLAVAQTLVIITGGIDISGGAIAGLGCMSMALLMDGYGTERLWLALILNFVLCTACGLLNGVIIFDLKLPAMIATLGTQTIFRGTLKLLSGGNSKPFMEVDKSYVPFIQSVGKDGFFPNAEGVYPVIPYMALVWFIVAIVAFLLLRYTVFGRNLFVVGSGVEVARLSGVKVRRNYYYVYALAGFIYGIAAVLYAGRMNKADTNTGEGADMSAIAAAVIGGASLAGGRGAITGTFVGTLLMVIIENGGKQFRINDHVLSVVTGALIIFAVAMDMMKSRKKG